jgi:hypothetical protein
MLRLGFERAEIEFRMDAAVGGPQPAALDLPADKASALEIMRYALAVMLADGSLSQEEVTFLIKLGAQLGVDSATLSSLGREAERLLSARTANLGRSSLEKIDALLPEASLNPPEASDFF